MAGRPLTAVLVAVALLLPPAAGNETVGAPAGSVLDATQHLVPVEGPIIDPFRPPDQPWLPGNRGLEFETESGSIAVASADGVVVFAESGLATPLVREWRDGILTASSPAISSGRG